MKKKLLWILSAVLVAAFALSLFAACEKTVVVKFYDGETVKYTQQVKVGGVPERPAPLTKDGFTFIGWFLTPTSSKEFKFTETVKEDLNLYAKWQSTAPDNRTWVIAGTSSYIPLKNNKWTITKDNEADFTLTKAATGNIFTITLDLYEKDEFKLTTLNAYSETEHKYALDYDNETGANVYFGLMKEPKTNFVAGGGIGDAPSNIKVAVSGKYKLTLSSDADTNTNNSLSWERIGDAAPVQEIVVEAYYIKGSIVTEWANSMAEAHKMVKQSDGTYKLVIELYQQDEFMFLGKAEGEDNVSDSLALKGSDLDTAHAEHVSVKAPNLLTDADGTYTFVYNPETEKLSVTYSADFSLPELVIPDVWYIAGSGSGTLLNNAYGKGPNAAELKLTKVAGKDNTWTTDLTLYAGDEFQFVSNPSTWANKKGFDRLDDVSNAGGNFKKNGAGNIQTVTEGIYKFEFTFADGKIYQSKITFTRTGDAPELEISTVYFIKGSEISDWKDVFVDEKKMTETSAGVHTLSIYLKANDEIMFASRTKIGETVSAGNGTKTLNFLNIAENDTNSLECVARASAQGTNMKTLKSGTYTFVYTETTDELTVSVDETGTLPEYDFYVKGKGIGGMDWQQTYTDAAKLAAVSGNDGLYSIELTLGVGAEFGVSVASKGAASAATDTVKGFWGMARTFKYSALEFDPTKNNIVCSKAGTYIVTANAYSGLLTVENKNPVYDIYIKGNVNEWNHAFAETYKFTKAAEGNVYELTIELAAGCEFGLDRYPEGVTANGTFIGKSNLVATDLVDVTGGNMKIKTAGTYKLVYDAAAGTITVTSVAAA